METKEKKAKKKDGFMMDGQALMFILAEVAFLAWNWNFFFGKKNSMELTAPLCILMIAFIIRLLIHNPNSWPFLLGVFAGFYVICSYFEKEMNRVYSDKPESSMSTLL